MYHTNKKKKEYRGGGMASDMLMKMMQGGMLKMPEMPGAGMMPRKMMPEMTGGGMMPKYPGGGMMPRKRGMMYQNGGPVDFGSDAVGEVLAGRASAANPNDMDFIRDLMVRAFNESQFGGENRGKPYRIVEPGSYDKPFFYNEGDEKSRQDVLSDVYEASGQQGTGIQGDYSGPLNVMLSALDKIDGMNRNQRDKARDLAFDLAKALYPSGF